MRETTHCSLLNVFLFIFWLPEVLDLIGLTPAQSVFASSLHALGGILAVFYLVGRSIATAHVGRW
jgi:hypothetical protein